eukprot:15348518-Ditylum_brightwellii.AAC.1
MEIPKGQNQQKSCTKHRVNPDSRTHQKNDTKYHRDMAIDSKTGHQTNMLVEWVLTEGYK